MKKAYKKPLMFMESFAISEHFATGAYGCDEAVHAETGSGACWENFYFGDDEFGRIQGFNELVVSTVAPCTYPMGCYHVTDGGKESAFYS